MEATLNILTGLLCTAVGGFMGHFFTVKLFNERVNTQYNAFYEEFEAIRDSLVKSVPGLLNDFESPLKYEYTALARLDLTLINGLLLELSASKKIPNKEIRQLIKSYNHMFLSLEEKQIKRDSFINKWFTHSESLTPQETTDLRAKIQFHTSQVLVTIISIIFHSSKISTERDNFFFSKYKYIEYADVTCRISNLTFDEKIWRSIIAKSIPEDS